MVISCVIVATAKGKDSDGLVCFLNTLSKGLLTIFLRVHETDIVELVGCRSCDLSGYYMGI